MQKTYDKPEVKDLGSLVEKTQSQSSPLADDNQPAPSANVFS